MKSLVLAFLCLRAFSLAEVTLEECLELYGVQLGGYSGPHLESLYRQGSRARHPDGGGSCDAFQKWQECKDLLEIVIDPLRWYSCKPDCGLCYSLAKCYRINFAHSGRNPEITRSCVEDLRDEVAKETWGCSLSWFCSRPHLSSNSAYAF